MEHIVGRMLCTYTKRHKEVAGKLGGIDPLIIKNLENSLYGNSGYLRHVGPYPMYKYTTTDGRLITIMD